MTSIRIYDKTDDFGDYMLVERSDERPNTDVFLLIVGPTHGDRQGIFVPLVELRAALDKIEANA